MNHDYCGACGKVLKDLKTALSHRCSDDDLKQAAQDIAEYDNPKDYFSQPYGQQLADGFWLMGLAGDGQ